MFNENAVRAASDPGLVAACYFLGASFKSLVSAFLTAIRTEALMTRVLALTDWQESSRYLTLGLKPILNALRKDEPSPDSDTISDAMRWYFEIESAIIAVTETLEFANGAPEIVLNNAKCGLEAAVSLLSSTTTRWKRNFNAAASSPQTGKSIEEIGRARARELNGDLPFPSASYLCDQFACASRRLERSLKEFSAPDESPGRSREEQRRKTEVVVCINARFQYLAVQLNRFFWAVAFPSIEIESFAQEAYEVHERLLGLPKDGNRHRLLVTDRFDESFLGRHDSLLTMLSELRP